jgi:hypothetical protein
MDFYHLVVLCSITHGGSSTVWSVSAQLFLQLKLLPHREQKVINDNHCQSTVPSSSAQTSHRTHLLNTATILKTQSFLGQKCTSGTEHSKGGNHAHERQLPPIKGVSCLCLMSPPSPLLWTNFDYIWHNRLKATISLTDKRLLNIYVLAKARTKYLSLWSLFCGGV